MLNSKTNIIHDVAPYVDSIVGSGGYEELMLKVSFLMANSLKMYKKLSYIQYYRLQTARSVESVEVL